MTSENPHHIFSNNKLLKKLDRVHIWSETGMTRPLNIDIDLTNKCSNRCPLCITKHTRDETSISFADAQRIISQFKAAGIKSIGLGGGGDPACNEDLPHILECISDAGIESGIYTNAHALTDAANAAVAEYCTWVRISLDAGTPEMYKKTHGMGKTDFDQTLTNIRKMVDIKNTRNPSMVIGSGYLIGPHTIDGIYDAALLSKQLGLDYIRFRPFFVYENSRKFTADQQERLAAQLDKAETLENSQFKVNHNQTRCESLSASIQRKYQKCYITGFRASITPDLKVYPCCFYKGDENYCIGDLKKQSFEEIWQSELKKEICDQVDLSKCPLPCQFENMNEFLWSVKSPVMHPNFL